MDDHSDQRAGASCSRVDAVDNRLAPVHAARRGDGIWTTTNLPNNIPLLREEIALLRAFLSDEIRAIIEVED